MIAQPVHTRPDGLGSLFSRNWFFSEGYHAAAGNRMLLLFAYLAQAQVQRDSVEMLRAISPARVNASEAARSVARFAALAARGQALIDGARANLANDRDPPTTMPPQGQTEDSWRLSWYVDDDALKLLLPQLDAARVESSPLHDSLVYAVREDQRREAQAAGQTPPPSMPVPRPNPLDAPLNLRDFEGVDPSPIGRSILDAGRAASNAVSGGISAGLGVGLVALIAAGLLLLNARRSAA